MKNFMVLNQLFNLLQRQVQFQIMDAKY